ncbi:MAG: hypothetical protein E7639_04290 [Ruminococcaceae bacterium]|nr:hypothetical protein [Oscillospiraceae bacterium]
MFVDMLGKKRFKLGLHQHTSLSDGALSPEEVAALYRDNGYDAIAITDHWCFYPEGELSGLPILSGAEYHVGFRDAGEGVFHILCLFADHAPVLEQESATAQGIINAIHEAGGLAVLAHPAWSMNTTERVKALSGFDATEIYNTVSHNVRRADSSILVDHYALNGMLFPLLAADDFHGPAFFPKPVSFVMVESEELSAAALRAAILEKRFYASTGPEIHLRREGNSMVVDCSPAHEIVFESNLVFSPHRTVVGEALTHAVYPINEGERFVRAYVTDADGRQAFSNFIEI